MRPLREAKARGVDVTGETCPQYLLLSTDDYARFGGVIRVNPPVRETHNQEPIWAALADGTIDMIATDHAPHTPEEKTRNDIWTVDCGFPGVETQMPLMLTEVNAGRMSICDYVRWSVVQSGQDVGASIRARARSSPAPTPISRWSISRATWTIDDAKIQSRSKISPWHGRAVKGLPHPHHGARPLRDARPRTDRRHARLRPLGARDPANAGAGRAQCRQDHAGDRAAPPPPRRSTENAA